MRELILGGVRSGKSAAALARAADWLAQASHEATLIATALPADAAMRARIERHRAERRARLPRLATVEVPVRLAEAIAQRSASQHLLVVDCLTLWAANFLAPASGEPIDDIAWDTEVEALLDALARAPGPLVLVSNEIGLGVIGADALTRRFVDALGLLNQRVAAVCERVSLLVAGQPLVLKGGQG